MIEVIVGDLDHSVEKHGLCAGATPGFITDLPPSHGLVVQQGHKSSWAKRFPTYVLHADVKFGFQLRYINAGFG